MVASKPERAADFINGIGVNTHLDQGNTAATIIADMSYLGLRHTRGVAPSSATSAYARDLGVLATAGLTFDLYTGPAIAAVLTGLNALVTAHPGAIASIEGPNEVNNFPITYNGLTGTAAALAYQGALYAAVHADATLTGVPVLNFTTYPPVVGVADASNTHLYPGLGSQPGPLLALSFANQTALSPTRPVYLTEAGYPTLAGYGGTAGVDATTQAKLELNLLMDAAKAGYAATFLYDLADNGAIASLQGGHYGLFTAGGAPKPSASAIHNLTSILADTGATASSFTPTALNDTISGLPLTGSSLVLETSSGVYDIVVWAEPTIWNATTQTPLRPPETPVSIDLGASFASVRVYDPLAATPLIATFANTETLSISVTDHPLIVQVSNFVAAAASLGPVGGTATGPVSPDAATPFLPLMYAR